MRFFSELIFTPILDYTVTTYYCDEPGTSVTTGENTFGYCFGKSLAKFEAGIFHCGFFHTTRSLAYADSLAPHRSAVTAETGAASSDLRTLSELPQKQLLETQSSHLFLRPHRHHRTVSHSFSRVRPALIRLLFSFSRNIE